MPRLERYRTRDDIRVDDIDEDRQADLRTAFENAVYGERIQECVAATFEVNEPIEKSGVVLSSWLHHDQMFDMVSSFGAGSDDSLREHLASATVRDIKTEDKLSAHVTEDRILVSLRDKDVSFESFAAYVLFLEQRLDVDLTPIIN